MTLPIPFPDSVITAGRKELLEYDRDLDSADEAVIAIFLAMAKALVEHDRRVVRGKAPPPYIGGYFTDRFNAGERPVGFGGKAP